MKVRVPEYFDAFSCLAGDCPHSCCEKWEVVIDEDHARRYETVPGPLGDRLRAALTEDEDGDLCFPLNGGRCPFLNGENLCDIHCALSAEATSVTCQEHPRFTEDYGPFREITLSASCPAANALLLGSTEPLRFLEREDGEDGEPGDEWLDWLLPLRDGMLALLADRTLPLRERLRQYLAWAFAVQDCLERMEEPLRLLGGWEPWMGPEAAEAPLFPGALRFLAGLERLEPDWPALLRQAETAPAVPVPEELLERIGAYFTFRYLLKAVNDGDVLGRAQLTVLAVLTVERLAAVCGLPEALRRFSCEIEHSDGNLDALLAAFQREEALSPARLLRALRG